MVTSVEDPRFFGVNWSALWRTIRVSWQQVHRWPVLRVLTPPSVVMLLKVDGTIGFWRVDVDGGMQGQAPESTARFFALEVADDQVLRRTFDVPASLNDVDLRRAVALEAQSNSPFPLSDLRWGFAKIGVNSSGLQHVQVVLASHRQLLDLITRSAARLPTLQDTPEIWVAAGPSHFLNVVGYGESARAKYGAGARRWAYAMVAAALLLMTGIALTPTLQLRERAIDAVNTYTLTQQRLEPLMHERASLLQAAEQINILASIVKERPSPLQIMDLLTQVLPDDTSLRAMEIKGSKVSIEGQTANAAELMQLIERQPRFRAVVAPTAATRPFGATKDNFKIEFMYEPLSSAVAPGVQDASNIQKAPAESIKSGL